MTAALIIVTLLAADLIAGRVIVQAIVYVWITRGNTSWPSSQSPSC